MKYGFFFLFTILLTPLILSGQDYQNHHMHMDNTMEMSQSNSRKDSTMNMESEEMSMDSTMGSMPSAFSRNLPMNVNGSGTSWHPRNSPMYMNMFHKKGWNFILHYAYFLAIRIKT